MFAGFNVSKGEYSLFAVTMVGSLANLVGSWLAYWIGYIGRVDVLEKHGKKLHIEEATWSGRTAGSSATATPPSSSPGCSRSSAPSSRSRPAWRACLWRFSVLTFVGCVPWVFMLTYIGKQAGDNWEDWKDSLPYVDYVVAAAIVPQIAWLLIRRRRGGSAVTETP